MIILDSLSEPFIQCQVFLLETEEEKITETEKRRACGERSRDWQFVSQTKGYLADKKLAETKKGSHFNFRFLASRNVRK